MNTIPVKQAAKIVGADSKSGNALPPPWRPNWLLAAPHRLAFFLAAIMLVLTSVWWGIILATRALNIASPWAVSVSSAHALVMTMGFMPLFFAGFLFTAGPKWLGLQAVSARSLLMSLTLIPGGWVFALIGFHTSTLLACAGVAGVATGWTMLSLKFFTMLRISKVADRVHARAVAFASGVGVITLWLASASLAVDSDLLLRSTTQVGLWGFVAMVFAVVSHRMIPFFGSSAMPILDTWRPLWLLWVMVAMLWLQAGLSAAEIWWWPLPPEVRWGQVAFTTMASLLLLSLAVRWGLVQSLKIRMLAMLHGGFVWLGISFALYAVSHALMALTNGEISLGLAPMHAMTMGYLGATMFAMTTRVSSGHGGHAYAADDAAWTLYWILQGAVVLRVASAMMPGASTLLTLLSVSAWTAAMTGWAIRYGRWFGRPRPDGRPG